MAYSYITQAFTRHVYSTSSNYHTGGNITCGQVKDFILANLPEATLESDNDPPLNAANNKHSTISRVIYIKIRGVRQIILMGYSHNSARPYGSCLIKLITQNGDELSSLYFGSNQDVTLYLEGLFVDGVMYIFKASSYTFKDSYGYILSDEDECIIMAGGYIFSLNNAYNYAILPTGYYDGYVNGKMILTEMMLKKLDGSEQTLRFKNKKIFRPGISTYFSLDRFYIGDDGHKYAYIGTINMLVQLE